MRLRDLAREHEADAGALRLRREERHEEVRAVGQARASVVDPHFGAAAGSPRRAPSPPRRRRPSRAPRRRALRSEVDEELLELVGVRGDRQRRPRRDADRQPRLERRDARAARSPSSTGARRGGGSRASFA